MNPDSEQRNTSSEKNKRNKAYPFRNKGKYRSIIFKDNEVKKCN